MILISGLPSRPETQILPRKLKGSFKSLSLNIDVLLIGCLVQGLYIEVMVNGAIYLLVSLLQSPSLL